MPKYRKENHNNISIQQQNVLWTSEKNINGRASRIIQQQKRAVSIEKDVSSISFNVYLKTTKILLFLTGKLYRFNRTPHSYRKCI